MQNLMHRPILIPFCSTGARTKHAVHLFKCDECDKNTFVENNVLKTTNSSVNPWEGDIEIVDIAFNEEQQADLESAELQNVILESLNDSKIELLLQKNPEITESNSITVNDLESEGKQKEIIHTTRKFDKKCRIMFSGYQCKDHSKIVTDLGGRLTSKLKNCSVMVTDRMRMTQKILTMLGRGVPVVSPCK